MSEISVMSQVLNEQIANMKRSIDKFSKVCSKVIEEFGTCTNETGNEVTADEDTISREAAVEICFNGWNKNYREIAQDIKDLPPSPNRPKEPQWIPVSERLPELDVNINVYTKKNPIMVSEPVCISYRLDGRDYVCPIPCILHSNGYWYIDNNSLEDWVNLDDYDSGIEDPLRLQVTAWMPLPEPYKEGGAV